MSQVEIRFAIEPNTQLAGKNDPVDATMCQNKTCDVRHNCVRSPESGTRISANQTWDTYKPAAGRCVKFWQKGQTMTQAQRKKRGIHIG